jgi:hypothetical protein
MVALEKHLNKMFQGFSKQTFFFTTIESSMDG